MPEPDYDDDGFSLYLGDALEVLAELPPESVDAVITDPPYIIGSMSIGNAGSKTGAWADLMNSAHWYRTWYELVDRVLKPSGAFWTFGNWKTLPITIRALLEGGLPVTSVVVWDKEHITVGGPKGVRAQYEMIVLSAKQDFIIPNRSLGDIWRQRPVPSARRHHPAEKPVGIVDQIIEASDLQPGAVVLDPFMGGGTTIVSALSHGLRAIGVEQDPHHFEAALQRLQALDTEVAR